MRTPSRRAPAERDRLRSLCRQAPGCICVLGGPEHVYELVNRSYYPARSGHRAIEGRGHPPGHAGLVGQGFLELLDEVYARQALRRPGCRVMLQREPGAPLAERFVDFVYQR